MFGLILIAAGNDVITPNTHIKEIQVIVNKKPKPYNKHKSD
jgi:hypothetical protein